MGISILIISSFLFYINSKETNISEMVGHSKFGLDSKPIVYSNGIEISDYVGAANSPNSFSGKSKLIIGELYFDPYTYPLMPIRTVQEISGILDHEYVHGLDNSLDYEHNNKRYNKKDWQEFGIPSDELEKLEWPERGLSLSELKDKGVSADHLAQFKAPKKIINDIVFENYLPSIETDEFKSSIKKFAVTAVEGSGGYSGKNSRETRQLITDLNKYYESKGLEPIQVDDLLEIELLKHRPERREELKKKMILELEEASSTLEIFKPKSNKPPQAAVFGVNEFINRYDELFREYPGFYEKYMDSFNAIKNTREHIGFADHSLDPHQVASILGPSPEDFREVTAVFNELSDEEIQKRAASENPQQRKITLDLLQFNYDVGRIDKSRFEKLRGTPCSEKSPCERGVLWKFGKLN